MNDYYTIQSPPRIIMAHRCMCKWPTQTTPIKRVYINHNRQEGIDRMIQDGLVRVMASFQMIKCVNDDFQ